MSSTLSHIFNNFKSNKLKNTAAWTSLIFSGIAQLGGYYTEKAGQDFQIFRKYLDAQRQALQFDAALRAVINPFFGPVGRYGHHRGAISEPVFPGVDRTNVATLELALYKRSVQLDRQILKSGRKFLESILSFIS